MLPLSNINRAVNIEEETQMVTAFRSHNKIILIIILCENVICPNIIEDYELCLQGDVGQHQS